MAYDLASRLLSRNYFAAGSGIAESTDTFTYDLASRPVTANNADALISYTYDSIGRRSSLTQTLDGLAKTVTFVYDAANRLLSRSPEGLAVESRSFTNRGQLAQVKLDTAVVASFDYDAVGRETSRSYGNGLNTTSGYSRADNLITSITVAGKPELSFNYSYDSNKNVTAEQRGGSMALYSWNATFDAMDRLNSQNDGVQTRSWNLDLVGNTTSETLDGNAEARTLNDMHAPVAAGNKAYIYDSNGQMTTKPGYALVWDARNHLVQSTGSAGVPPAAAPVVYRYDAFGNRVSKGSTRYLLVDNQVVAEFTGSASKQYCYGSYVDEVLAEKSGAAVSYYHRNRQYNTSALTDSSGAVLEMYSTDAMGRVKAFDAAATAKAAPTATTVLFTGRVFDVETSLYYFRARYFETELGVFISRDPLGFVDGMSVYQGWYYLSITLDSSGLMTDYFLSPKINVTHIAQLGPTGCGQFSDHMRFKLAAPLPYDSVIIQKIDFKRNVYKCGAGNFHHRGSPQASTYYEVIGVIKALDLIDNNTASDPDGVSDVAGQESVETGTTYSRGDMVQTGSIKVIPYSVVYPSPPLLAIGIFNTSDVPEAQGLPSTYTKPLWWDDYNESGFRSVSVTWNCCKDPCNSTLVYPPFFDPGYSL